MIKLLYSFKDITPSVVVVDVVIGIGLGGFFHAEQVEVGLPDNKLMVERMISALCAQQQSA